MRYRFRTSRRLGPVRLNFTERGFSSWSVTIWRWSWNSSTRRHTIDTPGPGYVQTGGRSARRRTRDGDR